MPLSDAGRNRRPARLRPQEGFSSARSRHVRLCGSYGARRSELLRSQVEDFDFVSGMATLREKKRDRGKEFTFRHVPNDPMLRKTMLEWFAVHPGGHLTVCEEPNVPMEPGTAHHHFRWTSTVASGSRSTAGTHCATASARTVLKRPRQRIIDSWMGHQTEDMRRRYRHLFPDHQQRAITWFLERRCTGRRKPGTARRRRCRWPARRRFV